MARLCGCTAGPDAPWADVFLPISVHLQKGWGHPSLPTRPVSIAKGSYSFIFADGEGASL